MDEYFIRFKSWIDSKKENWNLNGIVISDIMERTHAHQIHVNADSKSAFSHIALYESNNIYWIEFQAVNLYEVNYYKYIEFKEFPNLDDYEEEYLHFMTE